jgi:GT2 family glycosyltransferase
MPAACEGVACEVIVVSDFAPDKSAVYDQWLQRERRGTVDACNAACAHAYGEWIFLTNDESIIQPGAIKALLDVAWMTPYCLWAPQHVPNYDFHYFGKKFVPFPFVHRDLLDAVGGLFDPAYKCFYADPDLSLRVYEKGYTVQTIERAIVEHNNGQDEAKLQNMSQYMARDQATFRTRWGHLGEFCDC